MEAQTAQAPIFHTLYSVMQLLTFPLITSFVEFVTLLLLFQMVVVWDVSHAVRGGEMSIIAKAHTDVDICRMRIAEFDDSRYCKLLITENTHLFLYLSITLSFSNNMSSIVRTLISPLF